MFIYVPPACRTGPTTEGLRKESKMRLGPQGFACQAEELSCILRTLGDRWEEKDAFRCQEEGELEDIRSP